MVQGRKPPDFPFGRCISGVDASRIGGCKRNGKQSSDFSPPSSFGLWRAAFATDLFVLFNQVPCIKAGLPAEARLRAKAGGEGRNRTRPAFHKPLEINGLNHHRCLDIKGVCDLSQVNSNRLFLTPFYSLPMRFAGISAGTFTDLFTDWFAIILMSCRRWQRRWPWPMQQGLRLQAIFSGSYPPPTLHLGVRVLPCCPLRFENNDGGHVYAEKPDAPEWTRFSLFQIDLL